MPHFNLLEIVSINLFCCNKKVKVDFRKKAIQLISSKARKVLKMQKLQSNRQRCKIVENKKQS